MRRYLGLPILLLATGLSACQLPRPADKPTTVTTAPQLRAAQRQAQTQLCRHTSHTVSAELASLRLAELRLSRLRQQSEPAASDRPIWDEALEQRYSEQDRDLDRQRYERQLALWQQQQAEWQQAWEPRHRQELAEAQNELNARVRRLRRLRHDLFTAPGSIEVNPAVLAQIQHCPETG